MGCVEKPVNVAIFTLSYWRDLRNDPQAALSRLRLAGRPVDTALGGAVTFLQIVWSEYGRNHCYTRASALAFSLLLTLIPLITSASYMLSSVTEVHPEELTKFLGLFLPFAPPAVLVHVEAFFLNAQKLRGAGILILLVMAVGLFGTLEESFNAIWKVAQPRSLYVRLRTFTMVMVYGPILLLASFQIRVWSQMFPPTLLPISDIIAFLLDVTAFAMIIWFAPHTRVRFGYAFRGGLATAVLVDIERHFFSSYIRFSFQTQEIYGSFGILVFFLISVFFVALFILFGAEVAYVLQNFRALLRSQRRTERRVANHTTYLAVRMMIDVVQSFRMHVAPPSLAYFEKKYELTPGQAQGILKQLSQADLIRQLNNDETYVPARDFAGRKVAEIIDMLEEIRLGAVSERTWVPDDAARVRVERLMIALKVHGDPVLQTLTFGELLDDIGSAS